MDEKQEFQPEYFSGLNWRDALPLVGKVVEFSNDPDCEGWPFRSVLEKIDPGGGPRFKMLGSAHAEYIRTCPETCPHPTITIDGVDLPRPEIKATPIGSDYWVWKPGIIVKHRWEYYAVERAFLITGRIHLTEARAQAWQDWWDEAVIKKMEGE